MKRRLATFDIETDPFLFNRKPEPFCCQLYWGDAIVEFEPSKVMEFKSHFVAALDYNQWWGDECLEDFISFLNACKTPLRIYAHNGGKFDFVYLLRAGYLNPGAITIIRSRIVKAYIGIHELRDSFSIIPIPLAIYNKDTISYKLFEKFRRDTYKTEILEYLHKDCVYLYELVDSFIKNYGSKLTIGSTSITQLRKSHPFEKRSAAFDEIFRKYYFGGRVECYKKGYFDDTSGQLFVKIDVNSMYPTVMSQHNHPCGKFMQVNTEQVIELLESENEHHIYMHIVTPLKLVGLPYRNKLGLNFDGDSDEYFTHAQELYFICQENGYDLCEALESGVICIHRAYSFHSGISFDSFVRAFNELKIRAKTKAERIFAKLLLNSAYGKFAQNPEHHYEYQIVSIDDDLPGHPWTLAANYADFMIYKAPAETEHYNDVAIAASITAWARRKLALAMSEIKKAGFTIYYCDTDSVIFSIDDGLKASLDYDAHRQIAWRDIRDYTPIVIDNKILGAWDLEVVANRAAFAGKKMYALWWNGECVSKASKGVNLEPDEIKALAEGKTVLYQHDAPSFSLLTGETRFTKRLVKRT